MPTTKIKALEKFDEVAVREGLDRSKLLTRLIEEYIQTHGDGNPNYTMDHFQDSSMKAVPAFFRTREEWAQYLKMLYDQKRNKELTEIIRQAGLIEITANHVYQHGTHLVF